MATSQDISCYGTVTQHHSAPRSDDAAVCGLADCGCHRGSSIDIEGLRDAGRQRGEGLSGGQRPIAIARAYLSQPSLLLFDEPSNAMDNRSEEHFKAHLAAECRGRTLVLITHRASLLSLVDRVIVLEAGRVAADGPRDNVLAALAAGRVGAGPR